MNCELQQGAAGGKELVNAGQYSGRPASLRARALTHIVKQAGMLPPCCRKSSSALVPARGCWG